MSKTKTERFLDANRWYSENKYNYQSAGSYWMINMLADYAQEKVKEQRYEYKANKILLKARVAALEEELQERDKECRVLTDDEFNLLLSFAAKGVETMKNPEPYNKTLVYLQRKIYNELN